MKKIISGVLVLALLLCCTACGKTKPEPTDVQVDTQVDTPVDMPDRAAESAADFSLELACNMLQEGSNGMVSPLSAMFALTMAADGAQGDTLKEMEDALKMPIDELNQVMVRYRSDDVLQIANSIWLNKEFDMGLSEEYADTIEKYAHAELFEEIFDDKACAKLNDWCSEHTKGMIPKMLKEFHREWRSLLVNAICFDADWEEPYKEHQIREDIFYGTKGEEQVEFMQSILDGYISDDHMTGFCKDYNGGRYYFAAMLPETGMSPEEYLRTADAGALMKLVENAGGDVYAILPKFEMSGEYELIDALKAMGVKKAFDPGADFTKMTDREAELYITDVLQKTYIKVDETGTEASAVTVVIEDENCMEMEPMPEVILDRPFAYMIFDRETEMPLFIGVMNNG